MIVLIVILWIIFSIGIGMLAFMKDRNVLGFVLLSIFVSPLIALIILLILGDSDELIESQKNETFKSSGKVSSSVINTSKISDENKYENLDKLGKLFKDGLLTQEEFDKEKQKILNLTEVSSPQINIETFEEGGLSYQKTKRINEYIEKYKQDKSWKVGPYAIADLIGEFQTISIKLKNTYFKIYGHDLSDDLKGITFSDNDLIKIKMFKK